MAATTSAKKSLKMMELMAQTVPLRKVTTVKKLNNRSLLLPINEITHYFKQMDDWKQRFEKKSIFFTKT